MAKGLTVVVSVQKGDEIIDILRSDPAGNVEYFVDQKTLDDIDLKVCHMISAHMSEYLSNNRNQLKKEIQRYEKAKKARSA